MEIEPQQFTYDQIAESVIEMGNQVLDDDESVDVWDVASGMLAGAVQFWLFARQPCSDPFCEACADISTARHRLQVLLEETQRLAEDSDYFNSPHDSDVGRA